MFGFSMGEMLLLGVIALIVIGPRQLPEFARQVGRILNEIKRAAGDFSDEMKNHVRIDMDEINQRRTENTPESASAPTPDHSYAQHIALDSNPVDPNAVVQPEPEQLELSSHQPHDPVEPGETKKETSS